MPYLVFDHTHNVENDNDDGHVVAGVPSELFHGSRATHVEDLLAQFRQRRLLREKMTIDDAEARAGAGAGDGLSCCPCSVACILQSPLVSNWPLFRPGYPTASNPVLPNYQNPLF